MPGTFISAFLLLLRQEWRTSINRFAEAMTLFAVTCAGIFPLLHLGRPWLFYWLFPYPNTMTLWPQFRSPLLWDVFAVSTYATVSFLFWYAGLDSGRGGPARQSPEPLRAALFWRAGAGLAGFGPALAASSVGLLAAGRFGDAAGAVGPLDRRFGFCRVVGARLAQHDLSAVFRGGGHFSGFAMVLTLAIPLRYCTGWNNWSP